MRVRGKMPLAVGPIVAVSALAAGSILRATQEEAILSGPEYVRDAEPEGLTRRIGLGLARQACRRYADNPDSMNPTAAAKYENACRPYLDSVGYGSGPSIDQPFSGGQCCGVTYLYTYSFRNPNTGQIQDSEQTFANGQLLGVFERSNQPSQPTKSGGVRIRDCTTGQVQEIPLGVTFEGANLDQSVSNIRRADGLPDNCGSVPPEITQPEPPDQPGPTFEPIIIAPEINIDAGVTVNIDGTIEVQVGDDVIEIDPFGDGGDGGGDGGGNPPGAPEGGPVLPGGNGGFGGDDELGEPPAGKRWVGVCMAITQRPESFGTIPTNTVDKVYPEVVGNVRLICNAAGTEIVNTPVQIRSDRVCLWEPVRGLNPVAIRVNLKAGFGYSYQGYAQPIDN